MGAISAITQGASSLVKSLFGGPLKSIGSGVVQGARAINKGAKLSGNEALRGRYLSSLKNRSFTKQFAADSVLTKPIDSAYISAIKNIERVDQNITGDFVTAWKSTGYGQTASTIGKVGAKLAKGTFNIGTTAVSNPAFVVGAGAVGLSVGVGRGIINRYQERSQRGMEANHLGTDGLTLALSKRRHR